MKRSFIIAVLLLFTTRFVSQSINEKTDSTNIKKHSPKVVSIMSAIIPGAGQMYNKKYWKPPLLYAGFAALGYLIINNRKEYRHFNAAYKIRLDDNPNTFDIYDAEDPNFKGEFALSAENLNTAQNTYRRYFELSCIGIGLVYILNIVDAAVDAHLFYFDVNDNLSLKIYPTYDYFNSQKQANIGLTLTF